MPSIEIGTDSYELNGTVGQFRADHVRLADGSTHTFKMRKKESLREFEKRVNDVALASQVTMPAARRRVVGVRTQPYPPHACPVPVCDILTGGRSAWSPSSWRSGGGGHHHAGQHQAGGRQASVNSAVHHTIGICGRASIQAAQPGQQRGQQRAKQPLQQPNQPRQR